MSTSEARQTNKPWVSPQEQQKSEINRYFLVINGITLQNEQQFYWFHSSALLTVPVKLSGTC